MSLIVILTNDSKLAQVSDYNYTVLVGDGSIAGSKTLATGRVSKHLRSNGWKVLLSKLMEELDIQAGCM